MSVLSTEDRAFWEENGYVVIHDAAPPELIQTRHRLSGIFSKWMPTTLIVGTLTHPPKASW